MKTNLLSNMSTLSFMTRDGKSAQVLVKVFVQNGHYHIFLTDRYRPGAAAIARNAGHYANQILAAMDVSPAEVSFYRHVYQSYFGSQFGCLNFDWTDHGVAGYTFAMLTRREDIKAIAQLVRLAKPVDVSGLAPAEVMSFMDQELIPKQQAASISLL